MGTFPSVYLEIIGFFHRYMSIFSSIYNDNSEINEKLYEMLDLNKCDAELLEMYGSWFGIDLRGGFLPEDTLRTLVKEAYMLNRMKGTKWAIERIVEIVVGEDSVLLENRLQDGGIFDVTILVNAKLSEDLRHQLMFILDQFRPLRTRIRLLQMEKEAVMDGNSYLDMNAAIPKQKHVVLDEESMYDGAITLV
jgi:P2-related tail formation protein